MTLVLVSREALGQLIAGEYANRHEIAVEGGCASLWEDEWRFLEPDDVLVTLAVQAGLPIPGPMVLGTVPPAPPTHHFDVQQVFDLMDQCVGPAAAPWVQQAGRGSRADGEPTSPTYRADGDPRLRCTEDTKVVYTSMEQAGHAARRISDRQPMRAYLGRCGHYHVSRVKGDRR